MLHALVAVYPLVFNSDGLITFLVKNIVPLIVVVIGIGIIAGAKKGNVSGTFTTILIVCAGAVLIGGATVVHTFGEQIAHLLFGA